MSIECRFCARLGRAGRVSSDHDKILFESENFVVTPTLGALVEGWVLIAPKRHYLSFGAIDRSLLPELTELHGLVARAGRECYGRVVAFEHGPARENEAAGCTVDHAHLHLVPTSIELVDGLQKLLGSSPEWMRVTGIGDATALSDAGTSYLFLEEDGASWIAPHPIGVTQLFRRVIASQLGAPNEYDWRTFPHSENIRGTLSRLRRWVSESSGSEHPHLAASA